MPILYCFVLCFEMRKWGHQLSSFLGLHRNIESLTDYVNFIDFSIFEKGKKKRKKARALRKIAFCSYIVLSNWDILTIKSV